MSKSFLKIILILFLILLTSCRTVPKPAGLLPPQIFADKNSKFINIDGIDIHYKEAGEGPTDILLLHGMLGNIGSWKYIMPELSKKYRVAAYDRPAFGLTERPSVRTDYNPYTPEQSEIQALKLMSELGMDKPVLIGHSAGGNLALRLAINHPEKLSGLILISPGVYTEIPPVFITDLMDLKMFKRTGIDAIRTIPDHIDDLLAQTYFKPEMVSDDMIENYVIPTRLENWDWALWEYMRARDDSMIAERISEIELPILIIQGIKDNIVPPADNLKAADNMPNASLLFLGNCGHVAHEEKPERVIAAINDFISRL